MTESNDIIYRIESLFPHPNPLLPDPTSDRRSHDRMQGLLQLERQAFSVWFRWLTSDDGEASARQMDSVLRSVDKVVMDQ